MTIQEFIQDFKAKKIVNNKLNEHAVEDYIKETLQVKTYIPFAEKRELCASILEKSCNRRNGIITVDSVSRYILFTITILTKYTNLEFNSDENLDSLFEYDLLCESGLLDCILSVIGDEYTKCNNMLNMMLQDVIDNNNTLESVISNISGELLDKVEDFIDVLSEKVENANLDLNQIDIEKIKSLLEKVGGLAE